MEIEGIIRLFLSALDSVLSVNDWVGFQVSASGLLDGIFQSDMVKGLGLGELASFAFFIAIRKVIRKRIKKFMEGGFARMMGFISAAGLVLVTIWIMVQGYRIMTGESKDSLMNFVVKAAKVVVILTVAMNGSIFGAKIYDHTQYFQQYITYIVTGEEDENVYDMVDKNLAITQVMTAVINSVAASTAGGTAGGDSDQKSGDTSPSQLKWMSTFATAGPAVIGGTMCLLNEIAMALAIMFAPLFILSLMFEQTKNLFWNWIRYTVAVMFSMAVLAMVSSIVLEISMYYSGSILAAMLAQFLVDSASDLGIPGLDLIGGLLPGKGMSLSSSLMQSGGLGLVLSMLLLTVPPMVMQFFSANLGGTVSGYSPFGTKPPEQAKAENVAKLDIDEKGKR